MAPRSSHLSQKAITYGFWLVFDDRGGMRFARQNPNVGRDERAMFLEATLPRSLFATPPLRATISVADPGEAAPQIDISAASEALRQALGVDIDLKVIA